MVLLNSTVLYSSQLISVLFISKQSRLLSLKRDWCFTCLFPGYVKLMKRLQRSWEVWRCQLWRASVISPYKSLEEVKVLLCGFIFRTITETCTGHVCHNPFCSSSNFPGIIDTSIIKACLYSAVRLCCYAKGCWSSLCSFTWPLTSIVVTVAVKGMSETEKANLVFRNPLSLLCLLLKKSWGVWGRPPVK